MKKTSYSRLKKINACSEALFKFSKIFGKRRLVPVLTVIKTSLKIHEKNWAEWLCDKYKITPINAKKFKVGNRIRVVDVRKSKSGWIRGLFSNGDERLVGRKYKISRIIKNTAFPLRCYMRDGVIGFNPYEVRKVKK